MNSRALVFGKVRAVTHETVPLRRAGRVGAVVRLLVIPAVILALIGMGIQLTVSAWHTRSLLHPIKGGVTTTGTVISVEVHHFRGFTYAPVVAFRDESGTPHVVEGPSSSDPVRVGDSAVVSYDPRDPANAHDLSASSGSWQWPFYTGVFALAVALLLFGFTLFLLRVRGRAKSRICDVTDPRAGNAAGDLGAVPLR